MEGLENIQGCFSNIVKLIPNYTPLDENKEFHEEDVNNKTWEVGDIINRAITWKH